MTKELRGVLSIVALLAVALFIGRCSAPDNATKLLAHIADSVATAERSRADSVERARVQKARRDSIAAAAQLAEVNRQRDSVIRSSRIAQANAATQALNARQLAALQEATRDQLRAELFKTADQVDTLNATIEREREASSSAIRKQAGIFQERIDSLNKGYADKQRQDSISSAATHRAFERGMQAAKSEGISKGRKQGAAAVFALVVLGVVAKAGQ